MPLTDFQFGALEGDPKLAMKGKEGEGLGLLPLTDGLLEEEGHEKGVIVTLTSPTASGKGWMIAEGILRFHRSHPDWVFLYLCCNQLPKQEMAVCRKVFSENHADLSRLKMSSDVKMTSDIMPGDVVFIGFESISKDDNILLQQSERGLSLQAIDYHIRDVLGCRVCMIVDEAQKHYTKKTATNTLDRVDTLIHPDVEWRFSATPVFTDRRYKERTPGLTRRASVRLEDVMKAGFIRKGIVLLDPKSMTYGKEDNSGMLLESALRCRERLEKKWHASGMFLTPLIVMAIPSRLPGEKEDSQLEKAIDMLKKEGLTVEGGDVFVYTSHHKTDEDIDNMGSSVKVLITKEALSVGWDEPRAQILLTYRQINLEDTAIQWFGRILRQPNRHMEEDDDLNYGYLFTDCDTKAILAAMNRFNSVSGLASTVRMPITLKKGIDVSSFHLPAVYYRHEELDGVETDRFFKVWDDVVRERFGVGDESEDVEKRKEQGRRLMVMFPDRKEELRLTSAIIDPHNITASNDGEDVSLSYDQVAAMRDLKEIIAGSLSRAKYVVGRSKGSESSVRQALIGWFDRLGISAQDSRMMMVSNRGLQDCLDEAAQRYADANLGNPRTFLPFDFAPQQTISISVAVGTEDARYKKCIYDGQTPSPQKGEREFEEYMEADPNVRLWMRNEQSLGGGEGSKSSFGIQYNTEIAKETKERIMYPDYIVLLKSGKIVLVEVKGGKSDVSAGENEDKMKGMRDHRQLLSNHRLRRGHDDSVHAGVNFNIEAGIAYHGKEWLFQNGDFPKLRNPDTSPDVGWKKLSRVFAT